MTSDLSTVPGRVIGIALWLAQSLVALGFVQFGTMKLIMPIPELARMMPWTADVPSTFVRTMGIIDLAGGIGILLPALVRIRPGLTVAAALGCSVLQVCAIIFHLNRSEGAVIVGNLVLLMLSAFVFVGRARLAPITPR